MEIELIVEKLKDILSVEYPERKIFDKDVAAALEISKESLMYARISFGHPAHLYLASRRINT